MGSILTDCGIPYGITVSLKDYVSEGHYRANPIQDIFETTDFVNGCEYVDFIENDMYNFCVVVENNGEKYLIFQLEAYPRKTVIEWFNSVMETNPDKRAIVYTHSLLTETGEMYTQHSWTLTSKEWINIYLTYNTTIKSNMLNDGQPHEGDQLWYDALSLHDNLLCVVTSNAKAGKDIATKVYQNKNGYDVLTVVADLSSSYGTENNAFPILMKISEDRGNTCT